MRACNAGLEAQADPSASNDEGYTAWGRVPGNIPELVELMRPYSHY